MSYSEELIISIENISLKESIDIIDLLNKGLISTMKLNKYFQGKIIDIKVFNSLYSVRELFIYTEYKYNNIVNYKVFAIDDNLNDKNESISYTFNLSEITFIEQRYKTSLANNHSQFTNDSEIHSYFTFKPFKND